ncbi:hypothetical protein HDV00_010765 [Rhizophlyctis rosea]|nr:hypothetical protein HDV00_010765 [Rhizophlyctis rosea]
MTLHPTTTTPTTYKIATLTPDITISNPSFSSSPSSESTRIAALTLHHRIPSTDQPPTYFHPAQELHSTIIFTSLSHPSPTQQQPQILGSLTLPTTGPNRNWNFRNLEYLDVTKGIFVVCEEDDIRNRWSSLSVFTFGKLDTGVLGHAKILATSEIPEDVTAFGVLPYPVEIGVPSPRRDRRGGEDEAELEAAGGVDMIPDLAALEGTLVLPCISDESVGVILLISPPPHSNPTPSPLPTTTTTRLTYGHDVTAISFSLFPFSSSSSKRGLVITGHNDGRCSVFDFITGCLLVEVGGEGRGEGPVLGVTVLDDPTEWTSTPEYSTAIKVVVFSDVAGSEDDEGEGSVEAMGSSFTVYDVDSEVRHALSRILSSSSSEMDIDSPPPSPIHTQYLLPPVTPYPPRNTSLPRSIRSNIDSSRSKHLTHTLPNLEISTFFVGNPVVITLSTTGRVGVLDLEGGWVGDCGRLPSREGEGGGGEGGEEGVGGILRVGGECVVWNEGGVWWVGK